MNTKIVIYGAIPENHIEISLNENGGLVIWQGDNLLYLPKDKVGSFVCAVKTVCH